jgi:flagellin
MSSNSITMNPSALSARRYLDMASTNLSRAQNQLSSGLKAPDPSDDPSGSAVTSILTSAISALTQASNNAIQASSLVQLATGTLKSTSDILTRLATLAAQANSDSIDDSARQMLDKEYQALVSQIDKNAKIAWGEVQLFTGGAGHTNGTSYGLTTGASGIGSVSLSTAGTLPGTITALNFNQMTMSDSSPLTVNAPTTGGTGTVTVAIGSKSFTYAATTAAVTGTITFTATDGSGDNFSITASSLGSATTAIANATAIVTALSSALGTTAGTNTLVSQSVIGMSGTVYGTGGSKASSSGTVVSLIVGDHTFKLDMSTGGAIAANGSFVLTDDASNTITLKAGSSSAGFAANSTGATNLATALNTFFNASSILGNSGNGNGAVSASGNGLKAVPNAFTGALNTGSGQTSGFISGSVSAVNVVANGPSYDVSVIVGNQKFVTTTTPTASGNLLLSSVTDGNNKLSFNYAASVGAITNASSFQTALEQLLGMTSGSPASFTSASALMANTRLTPGAATQAGNYVLSYSVSGSTGTFKLSDGANSYTSDVTAAGSITDNITFDNGMVLNMSAFDGSTTLATPSTYSVTSGTAVNMIFQIGQQTNDVLTMTFKGMTAQSLGLEGSNITTKDQAGAANSAVLVAQKSVNNLVADLGGKKSQLSQLQSNLQVSIQNQLAAKATFSDAEITEALMDAQKYQAIVRMATSTFQKALDRNDELARMVEFVSSR